VLDERKLIYNLKRENNTDQVKDSLTEFRIKEMGMDPEKDKACMINVYGANTHLSQKED
jgi:hypothetical protein